MDETITLWFGDIGTRLDQYGNVYSVSRYTVPNKKCYTADLISIYQSILEELGVTVSVKDVESPYDRNKRRVIHTITSTYGYRPHIHRSFMYEYTKE